MNGSAQSSPASARPPRRLRQVVAWLAAAAFFGLFCAAGTWQWRRAQFKDRLFAAWAALPTQPEQPLAAALAVADREHLAKVRVRGHYLAGRNLLLDNQTREGGRIGVAVYSVLVLDDGGQGLLVNRGFAPVPRDRSTFPDPAVPEGTLDVAGILAPPPATGLRLGAKAPTADTVRWPLLTTSVEPAALSPLLGMPLLPSVLLLDPADPHGLERDWQPQTLPPERHRGYAVQWFGLAATVLVVTVLLSIRQYRRSTAPSSA